MILAAYPSFRRRLDEHSGVYTVTLEDGHYTLQLLLDDNRVGLRYANIYEVDGDLVTLAVPSGVDFDTPMSIRWRWSANEDGSLSFVPFSGRDRGEPADYWDLLTLPSWEPIG
jgi:hypothetical protein